MSYRYCAECNNKYKSFEDCPECGVPLYHLNGGNNTQIIKDSNQTIQVGGNNSGDIVIQSTKEKPLTLIQRDTIKPLTVGNTPVKTWWLPIIGLTTAGLGLTIELIKLITTFKALSNGGLSSLNSSPLSSLAALGLFGALFITGAFFLRQFILLKKRWHAGLPGNTLLERSQDGRLYKTKISGTCGQCNGNVTVDTFGQHSRVSCANNSAHDVGFDWTVLGDVADDYEQRQQQ